METEKKIIDREQALSEPVLSAEIALLRAENARLRRDGLTGAERFDVAGEKISKLFQEAYKQGLPVAIMMTDIDDFKITQDARNYEWGNHAIAMAAAGVESCLRSTDILFRFGGDELLAILIGAKEENIPEIIDRVEHCLDTVVVKGGGFEGKIALTAGAASSQNEKFETLQGKAEEHLKSRKAQKKVGR